MPETVRKTIILIDDNVLFTKLISDLLGAEGYSVIIINSSNDTFNFLDSHQQIDVYAVVLDYAMNDIKSGAIAKAIRKQFPDTCIIMISGCPPIDMKDINNLRKAEIINSFLEKPFPFQKLLDHFLECG